jgi:hypothetical protein
MAVVGDITDVKSQESLNTFTVNNEEMYNFESSYLRFWPVCDPTDTGRLDIILNSKMIYSAVPDCNSINTQDVYSTDLNAGKNTIVFKTSRGSYRVEQIKIRNRMKPVKTFLEYFEINKSEYDAIRTNKKDAMIIIEFVDDRETKKADVNVNGHLTRIDQTKYDYEKEISAWIDEGKRNYIEITPKTTLNIVELKVVVNEK